MTGNNWKNPDWDLAVNNTSSPRNDITTFSKQELVEELMKRDGTTSRIEAECIVDECGCKYQEYSDCAPCMKEHGVRILVIK